MPELPEVETVKRDLCAHVVGKKIATVTVRDARVIRQPRERAFVRALQGQGIESAGRRAKVLLLNLSSGKTLTVHLKMTGQLVYPGTGEKSRVSFVFTDGTQLDFNDNRVFGELRVVRDWRELPFIRALGPEPFDLTPGDFCARLAGKRATIKSLLMDQRFIAGIGNLYAAESLFKAGICPSTPAENMNESEKRALFHTIRATLKEAIAHHGSSVDQFVRLSGERGTYIEHHAVYGRQGKPCPACGTAIVRVTQGGRGTYYCPSCQRGRDQSARCRGGA
jgi:formamidopyrimidine-DNA glycosylase